MQAQLLDFSVSFPWTGMHDSSWGSGMWVFPLFMIIMMLVMAFLVCGRGARLSCGHAAHGFRGSVPPEDSQEILERRYAKGEITKDEFERIRKDLRGESAPLQMNATTHGNG